MSNRTNGNQQSAFVYGGVSADETTALWFREWPWPWWIDQPVKPGSRHDYEGKAPVLPSRCLAKIPGEFRRPHLDLRIATSSCSLYPYCRLYLAAIMSLVAPFRAPRIAFGRKHVTSINLILHSSHSYTKKLRHCVSSELRTLSVVTKIYLKR